MEQPVTLNTAAPRALRGVLALRQATEDLPGSRTRIAPCPARGGARPDGKRSPQAPAPAEQPLPGLFIFPVGRGRAVTRRLRSGTGPGPQPLCVPCSAAVTSSRGTEVNQCHRPGRAPRPLTRVRAARVGCSFLLLTARTVARTNEADILAVQPPGYLGPEIGGLSLSPWTRRAH